MTIQLFTNESIEPRFKHNTKLQSGYRCLEAILDSKGCKTVDELYKKGYTIEYNYCPSIIINVVRL